MRIAMAQVNSILGDFSENRKKILAAVKQAYAQRADLVVLPEASLFGYHPVDLLERESIVDEQLKELERLGKQLPEGISVLVGAMTKTNKKSGKPYYNAAVLLQKGKKDKVFAKQLLPTYDVFDEARHIEPGDVTKNIFRLKGQRVLVTICEDIWGWDWDEAPDFSKYRDNPLKKVKAQDVDLVVNLSASPFTDTKMKNRQRVTALTAKHAKAPMVYVNMVGAQDELIYDGASFAINKKGEVVAQCQRFEEDLCFVDLEDLHKTGQKPQKDPAKADLYKKALVLGIRDFVDKTGFKRVHLGLSGGIDSAVVAALAAEAIGGENLTCMGLPGPFNAPESLKWAKQLSDNLGAQWHALPVNSIYESAKGVLDQEFGDLEFSLVHENLQARSRAMLLMAYSNLKGSLLLTTSNKSELAMGYSTLYGDMTGGLMVIGDLLKEEVYAVARLYNKDKEVIPQEIIDRPPSAELRPNQKDEDSLPPYAKLDRVVEKLVESFDPPRGTLEKRVLRSLMRSEFKRWQAPPILKVSDHAFGRGRRLPVAHNAIF